MTRNFRGIPLCGPLHPVGAFDLSEDGRPDRFDLLASERNGGYPFFSSVLIRQRCRNVMFFRERITLELAFGQLRRLRGEPLTSRWADRIRPLLPEPQHAACLAHSTETLFDVVDRMTSMGRAEGGLNFFFLGFLAGCVTRAVPVTETVQPTWLGSRSASSLQASMYERMARVLPEF